MITESNPYGGIVEGEWCWVGLTGDTSNIWFTTVLAYIDSYEVRFSFNLYQLQLEQREHVEEESQ